MEKWKNVKTTNINEKRMNKRKAAELLLLLLPFVFGDNIPVDNGAE